MADQPRGVFFGGGVFGTVALGLVLGSLAIYHFRSKPAAPAPTVRVVERVVERPVEKRAQKPAGPVLVTPVAPRVVKPAPRAVKAEPKPGVWDGVILRTSSKA